MSEIHTFGTTEHLMRKAADLILEAAKESVRMRKRFVWFLAGGSTPAALYRLMTQQRYASRMPWPETYVFWGDERWLPPDHPENNARLARENLLDLVPIPSENIHPIITMGSSPPDSAAAMERQLRAFYQGEDPRPDLVVLGMGQDGHTASLFSGASALQQQELLYTATFVSRIDQWRITATLPLLNAARNILFLVAGGEKARAVRQVLDPLPETIVLPASLIRPTRGKLVWLLDREAGRLMPHPK